MDIVFNDIDQSDQIYSRGIMVIMSGFGPEDVRSIRAGSTITTTTT